LPPTGLEQPLERLELAEQSVSEFVSLRRACPKTRFNEVTMGQDTLAEMVGTTRSRVNFFMNKFRKLGFIHCNRALTVHDSLATVLSE
jgi:hypothetical protein